MDFHMSSKNLKKVFLHVPTSENGVYTVKNIGVQCINWYQYTLFFLKGLSSILRCVYIRGNILGFGAISFLFLVCVVTNNSMWVQL